MHATAKPQQALALNDAAAFDVLLLDMTHRDAKSTGDRLRARNSTAHTVWLVHEWTNEIAAQAAEVGVLQVLDRHATAQTIERVVLAALERTRTGLASLRSLVRPTRETRSIAATDAKNEFGAVLEAVARDGAVIITKHDAPRAVLVSVERAEEALTKHEPSLTALTKEFDALVERMQTPRARAAARRLFTATTEEFGAAAIAGARKPRE